MDPHTLRDRLLETNTDLECGSAMGMPNDAPVHGAEYRIWVNCPGRYSAGISFRYLRDFSDMIQTAG
ncbi:hypothetical protein PE067_13590 [Paracoccus sp. DMF-8]|uniref:hypothetical protein n=1 Tax=Paracoccus sp. DMF-8 TaxID=3019445 RepID=UPI0023E84BC1|nr:hypothetical protein [Paracoccus sp. DMF-8]MDF3607072.1 hypothetical protein [Paracoccus sp. DMF-8]